MIRRLLLGGLLLLPGLVMATQRNDVPSCYEAANLMPFRSAPSGRMLTVAIDQTTPLSVELQKTAWGHIKRFIKPGDKLRLYSFSAYLDGRYTSLQFSGELENPLSEDVIGGVPMMPARKLDGCLKGQPAVAFQRFGKAFAQAMGQSRAEIPRSEILFSMKAIAEDLRNTEGVTDNVILLMSDMLEYSDFANFYAANHIRDINPTTEMAKVEKQNLLTNFGGARVYVLGAAFVPTEPRNGYRSGKMIQNLENFWSAYFLKSNAVLKGFGTPELTAVVE
jgi:hypothetical protein